MAKILVFPLCYMKIFEFGVPCHVDVEHIISRVAQNQVATIRITGFMGVIPFLTLILVCLSYGLTQEGWVLFRNTIQFVVAPQKASVQVDSGSACFSLTSVPLNMSVCKYACQIGAVRAGGGACVLFRVGSVVGLWRG